MKRRIELALVLSALSAFAAACQSEAGAPVEVGKSEAAQRGNSSASFSITPLETSVGACEVTRCFDVSSSKDISHISVEADACPGATISCALYAVEGGERATTGSGGAGGCDRCDCNDPCDYQCECECAEKSR